MFGIGCHVITGLEAILNEVKNKEETQIALENLANSLDMTVNELADNIAIVGGYPEFSNEVIEKLSELYNDKTVFMDDIQSLKKKIKYSKNPLEKKMLNKQLNECYKEQKKTNTRGGEKDR
ncbi:hypothetical protein [Enterocloster clostridioformis]|uniref:Uncharacterized protein n=1 Tax=Enterocloster clostridioformis TaxID=1531 RepID=A0AAP9LWK5_9FIRM|nr:hypothetical protein [Enterocloster clostridioformis]QIX89168.1 hypothetical protein FOC47_00355 [Enterocloster clostridioformis]